MIYLGLDPGVNGGIAAIDELGIVQATTKMPETDVDLLTFVGAFNPIKGTQTRAMIERVHSSPQMGVVSAFTFGRGYGALKMALCAESIPFDEVTPRAWQQAMGCRTKGNKNISKARAQQLFPRLKVTHALADALLLAEYARRVERGRR